MSVSVIMPVHGKVDDYGRMLENIGTHLSNQSVLPHEWILVCDSDSTWLHQISLPSFTKIIVSPQNSASQKRNMGLDEAGGEFILLLDSDQWPETPDLISECITVAQQGYDILLIPEKFSNSGPYLKRCYHHLRGLYWKHSGGGIPRFFRKSTIGDKRYDLSRLHFEDVHFHESVRGGAREGVVMNHIIHNEPFHMLGTMRKARIAQKQKQVHGIKSSFRLSFSQILGETPLRILPGVVLILILRTLARRLLPMRG